MPLELIYSLIYSTASATSLVNLFHMFIPFCVKQSCTSSPLSLDLFIFRQWPQLPCPSQEICFLLQQPKEQPGCGQEWEGHASSMPATAKTDTQQKARSFPTSNVASFAHRNMPKGSPVSRGIQRLGRKVSPYSLLFLQSTSRTVCKLCS